MIELKFNTAQDNWLEATWTDGDSEVKHTSYHPTQLDLLQADAAAMGTPLDAHADMLAAWVASYVPPPPEPIQVPQEVTAFQAKAALDAAGLYDAVEAMMADAATPRIYKLAWREAQVFRRDSPTVLAMASTLGLTSAQVDDLFINAVSMVA